MFGLTPFSDEFLPARRGRNLSDFHSIIDDFFNNDRFIPVNFQNDSFKIDVRENENEYLIDAELPGVEKEEIKIDYENNQLSIAVQREESTEQSEEKYLHRERKFKSMRRTIYLPHIESEDISATFENGILEIVAKKAIEKQSSSRIEIQ